jgi:hypothetical protein
MTKSQLIIQVIVNAAIAADPLEANTIFIESFVEHYAEWKLEQWNTEVPEFISNIFLSTIDTNRIEIKDLIRDLDLMYKKMNIH